MKYIVLIFFYSLIGLTQLSYSQIAKPRSDVHDDPASRAEYDFMRLRDPATDEIPELIAQKEFEFAKKLPKHYPGGKTNLESAFEWQAMGPMNQSGRVQALGIDILNAGIMLAGTASGGVWRSIDGGQSWLKVTLPNDEQTISAIVQDTRHGKESTWYYSTGELLTTTGRRLTSNIRTHSWGNGIYKSTDNGATWNPLLSTVSTTAHPAPVNFTGIWNLALDHKNLNQDIIYAACYGGIMRSSDGGATWTNVLGGDSAKCFNSEIVMGSGGSLYAAIGSAYNGMATPHQGIWHSKDGINWTNLSNSILPTLIRRTRLALSESSDTILYCLTETPQDWTMADQIFVTEHSLSRYSTKGNWEERTCPFDMDQNYYNNSLGGYCLTLAVHPDDPDQVFVGGNSLYYSNNGFMDAGQEIGGYSRSGNDSLPLHPDMHTVIFSNTDRSIIYVGNDGGVFSTDDYTSGMANWQEYDNGLSSTQIYHSSLDHATTGDNFIVSGIQDNYSWATMSAIPSDPWTPLGGGDGMTTAICNRGALFFASYQSANIFVLSTDATGAITEHGQLPPPSSNNPNFFTNYILEPNQTNELYLAFGDEIWRYNTLSNLANEFSSNNYLNADWTEIPSARTTLNPLQAFVTTFGFATDVRDRLFFGTNIGKLYQVDNAAAASQTLKDISGADFPKNGFVAGIEVDPLNAKEIIVVFSNYNVQSLFRTTDGGTSWNAIGGNIEELPDGAGTGPSVRCAKILHTTTGITYYVGTSVGLYSTTKINGMQTVWTQEGPTTIGTLIVESLDARQADEKVVVSTQGGGVFVNTSSRGVKNTNSAQQFLQLEQNYPNPFTNHSTIRFILGMQTAVAVEMYNALGEKISMVTNSMFDAGMNSIELNANNLPSGNYFLRFAAGDAIVTKMITIQK